VVKRQKEEARREVMKRRALEMDLTKKVPRSVFSKEELLQQRRERYQAEKERIREMSPAEQSAQRWLQWRRRNPEKVRVPTAEESVREWRAYREAQKLSEGRQMAAPELSRDDDDFRKKRKVLERSMDYGLEL
jgi:hypothetical protein